MPKGLWIDIILRLIFNFFYIYFLPRIGNEHISLVMHLGRIMPKHFLTEV